jgi:hypothetical protein
MRFDSCSIFYTVQYATYDCAALNSHVDSKATTACHALDVDFETYWHVLLTIPCEKCDRVFSNCRGGDIDGDTHEIVNRT